MMMRTPTHVQAIMWALNPGLRPIHQNNGRSVSPKNSASFLRIVVKARSGRIPIFSRNNLLSMTRI